MDRDNKGLNINKGRYLKALAGLLIFAFLVIIAADKWQGARDIDYRKEKNKAVFYINKEKVTLADMAYLITLEERRTEDQAVIYSPDAPKDYWNSRNKGLILSASVKKTTLQMAEHDAVMYRLAKRAGIKLTDKEKKEVQNTINDFWDDLYDIQTERLYTSKEKVNTEIMHTAIVQKYQAKLADKAGVTFVRYGYSGDHYLDLVKKKKIKIKVNNGLWNRVRIGEVTLHHTKVNYVHRGSKIRFDINDLMDLFKKE